MVERNYWQRMKASRLSRRALVKTASRAGVGAAGLALVGCGDDDDDDELIIVQPEAQQTAAPRPRARQQSSPTQQQQRDMAEQQAAQAQQQEQSEEQSQDRQQQTQGAAQPQEQVVVSNVVRGGDLRLSTPARAHDYFDPHRAVFGSTQFWMGFYMNNVVRWRNKAQAIMEPDICSLPETPDEETYVFRVDQGARFWDQYPTEGGRLVTSEDIRANFQRHIDGRDATGTEDGTFPHRDSYAKTASMDTPDDLTFIARTEGPDATWLGIPWDRSAGSHHQKRSPSSAIAGETNRPTSSCPAVPA